MIHRFVVQIFNFFNPSNPADSTRSPVSAVHVKRSLPQSDYKKWGNEANSVVYVDIVQYISITGTPHLCAISKDPAVARYWWLECGIRTPYNSIIRTNPSRPTYHKHDSGMFHFHYVPWGGRTNLKGTVGHTCLPLKTLLSTTLHRPRLTKTLQRPYGSPLVGMHVTRP